MKLVFIPVSGPRGLGEYARALEIASAVSRKAPEAQIQFVLSRDAPYAADCPFPALLLPSSPTFHPREVARFLQSYRPDVVLFDNAGRTKQLQAARDVGARVIYVSSRKRQRHKAFRLSWMRLLDEHWIAYPEFIAGSLSFVERFKLRCFGKPVVRFLDTILPEARPLQLESLAGPGFGPGEYLLLVLGGGSAHRGAENAPGVAAAAAARLAAQGLPVVLVGSLEFNTEPGVPLVKLSRVPMAGLMTLIKGAKLVVTNGGDTLLQVLALAKPCIACAVAHDQAERIRRCAERGLLIEAELKADTLEKAALALWADEPRLRALPGQRPITDGLGVAVTVISDWLSGVGQSGPG